MILAMTKALGFEPSGSEQTPSHSFGISLPFRRSGSAQPPKPERKTLSQVRLQVELALQDIEGPEVDRLRFKIRSARDVQTLWLMRVDLHQMISMRMSQQVAAERINNLLPCFEGWIAPKSMSRI